MNSLEGGRRGRPVEVRLPGFISEEAVGLGDIVKRATSLVGIKPCGGCDRRAQRLNQQVVFRRR